MDNREKLLQVFKRELPEVFTDAKIHYYDNISEKTKNNIIKNFDMYMNWDSFIAYVDTRLLHDQKKGVIFTLYGFYYYWIEKPEYFNYQSIKKIYDIPSIFGSVTVTDNNGYSVKMNVYANYSKLKSLLEKTIAISAEWANINGSERKNGKVKEFLLTKEQEDKCNNIIHLAAVAAGGVGTGLAQIPVADNAAIVPIQITMIISLGSVFEIRVTESFAKSIIGTCFATFLGRGISQALVGWIPGIGNAINTGTAFGVTETVGWVAVEHFLKLQQEDKSKGLLDGMKKGYIDASNEYEKKLKNQADKFLNEKVILESQFEEYKVLLDDMEDTIEKLENKLNRTEAENKSLYELISKKDSLKQLPMVQGR